MTSKKQPKSKSAASGSSAAGAKEEAKREKLRKLFALAYDIGRRELEVEKLRAEYLRLSQEFLEM